MVNRLKLTLEQAEYTALVKMALGELRSPADQVRFILREEAQRRGLLPADAPAINSDAAQLQGVSNAAPN